MKRLLTAALGCLAGLTFSALALAAPADGYDAGMRAGMELSKTMLGGAYAAGITACQDQARVVTLAAEAKARGLTLDKAGPTFDQTPAGPVARRVYAGELEPHPAALDHLNDCLTRLRAKLE
jgi:hypothetical protein